MSDQAFDTKVIKGCIERSIDPVLRAETYDAKKVQGWSADLVEHVLKFLQDLNKPFKYVVTCLIMEKNGAGLHTASTCYWDKETDGSVTVQWDNLTMTAIVTVFALHY